MGLFDGAVGHGRACVHRAGRRSCCGRRWCWSWTRRRSPRSVAALVHGFRRPGTRRCGSRASSSTRSASDRHEADARDAVDEAGVPVLGVLRRAARRRGAVPAPGAGPGGRAACRRRSRRWRRWPAWSTRARRPGRAARRWPAVRPTSAVAPWDAGHGLRRPRRPPDRPRGRGRRRRRPSPSRYAETRRAAGRGRCRGGRRSTRCATSSCRRVRRGLVIGGGFPEVLRRRAVRQRAAARRRSPQLAADGGAGRRRVRRAAVPGAGAGRAAHVRRAATTAALDDRRLTLGYRDAVALADSVLAAAGTRVTGHEFHRTRDHRRRRAPPPGGGGATPAAPRRRAWCSGRVHASYLHVHWAGHPHLAARFVGCAAEVGR